MGFKVICDKEENEKKYLLPWFMSRNSIKKRKIQGRDAVFNVLGSHFNSSCGNQLIDWREISSLQFSYVMI